MNDARGNCWHGALSSRAMIAARGGLQAKQQWGNRDDSCRSHWLLCHCRVCEKFTYTQWLEINEHVTDSAKWCCLTWWLFKTTVWPGHNEATRKCDVKKNVSYMCSKMQAEDDSIASVLMSWPMRVDGGECGGSADWHGRWLFLC